jgi:hypothetical protein
MRRKLSSRITFLWNFVLPTLVIGAVSLWLVMAWFGKSTSHEGGLLHWINLCLPTIFAIYLVTRSVRSFGSLKQVEVDDDTLYVSNHLTEVRIPLSEVAAVREHGIVSISFRTPSAFGKSIEFLPRLRVPWSGNEVTVRELKALCKQASARSGVDQPTPFDPTGKIFEAGDDCVQVGKDYLLYSAEGKDEAGEKDKFYFKNLARITVIRNRKSGNIAAIDYQAKGRLGTFEIAGFEPMDMEEIANRLQSRAKGYPIQFLEKQSDRSGCAALISLGLGAFGATFLSGWLLYFGWKVREELWGALGLTLFGVICLGALFVMSVLWVAFWRCLRN